ncbi:hypothetical protein ACFY0R_20195 [Streptomyces sp. NPDC001633]|uniref:alpha-L-rhamnosidase-related protein n=1 Tax=Streptomyces sp. NPDC001633 TaxID=3364595 RepID=UPI00368E3785
MTPHDRSLHLLQRYGDAQVVRDHYGEMAAWIDSLTAHSSGLISPAGGYGEWLGVEDGTPPDLIGTAYFVESTAMMAQMARALGKSYDAAADRLAAGIKEKTVPSWGCQIGNGATRIWAREGRTRTNGVPHDPALYSLNHFGLGAVGD